MLKLELVGFGMKSALFRSPTCRCLNFKALIDKHIFTPSSTPPNPTRRKNVKGPKKISSLSTNHTNFLEPPADLYSAICSFLPTTTAHFFSLQTFFLSPLYLLKTITVTIKVSYLVKMGKVKESKKSKSKDVADPLTTVKHAGIKKASGTPQAKAKQIANGVAKAYVNGKQKVKPKPVESSSEEDSDDESDEDTASSDSAESGADSSDADSDASDDSSDSDSESDSGKGKKKSKGSAPLTNGKPKAAAPKDDDSDSDSESSDEEAQKVTKPAKANGVKPKAKPDDDGSSESSDSSDEEEDSDSDSGSDEDSTENVKAEAAKNVDASAPKAKPGKKAAASVSNPCFLLHRGVLTSIT